MEGAAAKAAAKADLAEESGDLGGTRQLKAEETGAEEEEVITGEVYDEEVYEEAATAERDEYGAGLNGTLSEKAIDRVNHRLRGSLLGNGRKEKETSGRDSTDLVQKLLDAVLSRNDEVEGANPDVEGEVLEGEEATRRLSSASSLVMSTMSKAGDPWAKKKEAAQRKREKLAAKQAAATVGAGASGPGATAGATVVGAATGAGAGTAAARSSSALAKATRKQQHQQQMQLKEQQREQQQHQQQETTAATVAALAHELPPGALTSFAGMATDFATVLH